MYSVKQCAYSPDSIVKVLESHFVFPSQMTLPTSWGHIVMQSDRGYPLTIQTVIGHTQSENVGVIVAQDTLPQN